MVVLGIDLGTSSSAAAAMIDGKIPDVIRIETDLADVVQKCIEGLRPTCVDQHR